ncbi:GNAT family N-acetyltransferase [Paenisporosarcina quisquiliarum]|uniref:GNAT family N-acetyltransferase n=1 Tax=Paenisporosarcina quisquiliarum TaxID=365346 RepID=UPI0037354EB4
MKNILRLPKGLSNYFYFGAYKDDQLLGFTEWRIYEDGIFLNQISLFANYRGLGIGKALLEHGFFLAKLYKKNKITLDVFEDNQFAELWYKNNGFKNISSKQWYVTKRLNSSLDGELTEVSVVNFHTSEAEQALYDFSNVFIKTSKRTYQVGRIKALLFRVTGLQAIEDEELQCGLQMLDDTRSLLLVSEKEIHHNQFQFMGLTKRLSLITN